MKFTLRVLLFALIFCLCGCSKQVALTVSDELVMNKWEFKADNGVHTATLDFNDNMAFFTVYENNICKTEIDGAYIIDNSRFIITDKEFPATFSFGYKLHGDTVSISYGEDEITMKRLNN